MEAPMFTKDNRGDRRMPVDILLNKYIDGEPHTCRAVNISRGGMLLYKIFEPDVEHSDVSLEFQLPGSQRILRIDGVKLAEHKWARAHGVRFTRMSDDDKELLERFVRGTLAEEAAAL
jgi:c-di-GMP-binding flagellar brake protein YcgR